MSLDDALALAAATSENAAIAQAGVQRARANVARTESQAKPQLNGSASYQRTLASQFEGFGGGPAQEIPPECTGPFAPDPNLPLEQRVALLEKRLACPPGGGFGDVDFGELGFGAANTWNLGLAFNWTFFTGGRIAAQVRAAEELEDVAESNVAAIDAQTRLDVIGAYFDAQFASELVDIAEASLANAEETLRITTLRANEGAQAEFDVLQARVTRDNQRPLLIQRQTQHELAFDRLRALLDLPEAARAHHARDRGRLARSRDRGRRHRARGRAAGEQPPPRGGAFARRGARAADADDLRAVAIRPRRLHR